MKRKKILTQENVMIQSKKAFFSALLSLSLCMSAVVDAAVEQTLSIIKPEAVVEGHMGEIIATFEREGLKIVGMKMVQLTEEEAGSFYAVHAERPFYKDLCRYMSSGPVLVQVLSGEDAIRVNRELMGATDPRHAKEGTIRARFARSIQENTVHGSDSRDSAAQEIRFFFKESELTSDSLI